MIIHETPNNTHYIKHKKPKPRAHTATRTPDYYHQYIITHKKRKKDEMGLTDIHDKP